jgi:hypothetical protein
MSMTYVILALTASFALLAALLTYLLLLVRIHWVLKLMATVATVAAIPLTFWGVGELRGLPSDSRIPSSFRLLWAEVVEPNTLLGEKGHVYLWLLRLDSDNFPVGVPRAYQLPYSDELQLKVSEAMGMISDGEQIQGMIDAENQLPEATPEELAAEIEAEMNETQPGGGQTVGERISDFEASMLTFGTEAVPITPSKPP